MSGAEPRVRPDEAAITPGAVDDVVFTFSFETYADAARRGMMRPPDRIVMSLMRSDKVGRMLVANPFRWMPRVLVSPLLDRDVRFPASERVWLHSPVRLRRTDRLEPAQVAREYADYDRALRRQALRRGLVDPVVLTCNPLVAGFAPFDWARQTTFFARDDWLSSPGRSEYWPAFREAYRRISASGRAVAAVSSQIIERIDPSGPHEVVPNGVEPAEWRGPKPEEPAWMAEIPHPRAVYVGTLDGRLDVAGIAALARARPDVHTVLLGPLPDPAYVADLRALPNVHVHPSVGRAELIATLRNSDVALVAHRRTPLTEAMSPLKLYEYLAAGLPVLSIDLPPVRGISDRVTLTDSVADFVDVVDAALAAGPAIETERLAFVEANSWAARHERIIAIARGA
ncbi:glycosyltransferase [Microbacterium hominis]|uniref:Glycosyltransferase n=1 Tax=Microbacterium hominis TaxID=162426 RepID=A0A7D4Q3S8_9MICO|nr:glycosyltransferase [Microbacterium hominis]QKJ20291.1 glycosyltransferase [Microbacterium hominis]